MKFAEINIDNTVTINHEITSDDIVRFVALSVDDNRLHVDKEYVSHTQFKRPVAKLAHYITATSALAGYVKSLAVDMAPFGIRMNLVSPGMVNMELVADIPLKSRLLIESSTLLKRLGTTHDVSSVETYLMGADSDFFTGETLRINGGQVMI